MTEPQSPYSAGARLRGAQVRILVVDDDAAVRRYVCRVLGAEGYAVCEAVDGAEALALVHAEPDGWDLIVSDIVMPRCNGVELYQQLVALASSLPVIFMSGYGSGQLEELGIAAPCGVLAKPFEPHALLDEVRRCLPVEP